MVEAQNHVQSLSGFCSPHRCKESIYTTMESGNSPWIPANGQILSRHLDIFRGKLLTSQEDMPVAYLRWYCYL